MTPGPPGGWWAGKSWRPGVPQWGTAWQPQGQEAVARPEQPDAGWRQWACGCASAMAPSQIPPAEASFPSFCRCVVGTLLGVLSGTGAGWRLRRVTEEAAPTTECPSGPGSWPSLWGSSRVALAVPEPLAGLSAGHTGCSENEFAFLTPTFVCELGLSLGFPSSSLLHS